MGARSHPSLPAAWWGGNPSLPGLLCCSQTRVDRPVERCCDSHGARPSASVPTSGNVTPCPPPSRRPECWGDTPLFAKPGEVVSIHCLLLHPWPWKHRVLLQHPWGQGTTRSGGHGKHRACQKESKKSPNRKGSFFWRKGGEEPASWRSCRQKPWLEIGLGQHSPTAHLHCGRRSRAALVLHRPSWSQAGGCPHRGETQAVPTANFQTGDNPTNLVGFWGEDAENPLG